MERPSIVKLTTLLVLFHLSVFADTESKHLSLEKSDFVPGENVVVSVSDLPKLGAEPWVGIVPSGVAHGSEPLNDREKISWTHVKNAKNNKLFFDAPTLEGSYDLRLNDTVHNGSEVDYITFQVTREPWKEQVQLSLNKEDFSPSEPIYLSFEVPHTLPSTAWVALVPASTPKGFSSVNDKYDLEYRRLDGTDKGTLTFNAPNTLGDYDLRIHDANTQNSIELGSVSFIVSLTQWQNHVTLETNEDTFSAGDSIFLSYSIPHAMADNAYVSIVPSTIPHGNESINDRHGLAKQSLKGNTKGVLEFVAPEEQGTFDIRLHSHGFEITHLAFTAK